jgi:hypothetical protein
MPKQTALDNDLVNDLISHLELGVRGGVPSPEYAAQLLRRVNLAVVESRRGFAAGESDQGIWIETSRRRAPDAA